MQIIESDKKREEAKAANLARLSPAPPSCFVMLGNVLDFRATGHYDGLRMRRVSIDAREVVAVESFTSTSTPGGQDFIFSEVTLKNGVQYVTDSKWYNLLGEFQKVQKSCQ